MESESLAPSPAPPPALPRWRRWIASLATAWVGGVLLAGAARLWPGDAWLPTELAFHVPWPLVLGPALLGLPLVGSWRRLAALGGMLLVVVAATLRAEQPRLLSPGPGRVDALPEGAVTMTAWNVMSFNLGKEEVPRIYASDAPDIIVLAEGTYRGGPPPFLKKRMGPDYQWVATLQLAVGSRLPILQSQELPTATALRALRVEVEGPEGPFALLVVDAPRPPRRDTTEMMREVWALGRLEKLPFVLVGDLNTARGSRSLRRATRDLVDFHAECGPRGWLGTWPAERPWYQIDHAFAGNGLVPLAADIEPEIASDHLRQRLSFLPSAPR